MPLSPSKNAALVTAGTALALLAWDSTRLDMALAHAIGGTGGFPLREHWLLSTVLHEGGRYAGWLVELALCLAVWWPPRWMAGLDMGRRLQLAVTPLVLLLAVNSIKAMTGISCPWDLAEFGGVARYVPHWTQLLGSDGGSGRCFPAGHASAGFAFIGGWFVLARTNRRAARFWLAGSLAVGLVLGIAQQLRGAHFMSHTLWAAWMCWVMAWLIDMLFTRLLRDRPVLLQGEVA